MKTVQKVYDLMMDGGNENLDKATKLINSIKKEDLRKLSKTELGEFFFLYGKLAYLKDFPDEAIKLLKTSLKLRSKSKKSEVLYYIASSYSDKEKFKLAMKYLNNALNCNNTSVELKIKILTELCISCENLDEFNKERQYANQIIEIYKNNPNSEFDKYYYCLALSNLVTVYWKLQDEKKADEYANKLLSMKKVPQSIRRITYNILGHRFWWKKEHGKAIECYRKALKYAKGKDEVKHDKDLIKNCKEDIKASK